MNVSKIFLKLFSFFTSIIMMICLELNIPCYPMGEKLDMSKFTLTFEDDFSDELDRSIWSGHYQYGNQTEARKGSYWNQNLAYTKDGNLIIPVIYLEEGMGGKGAGWYSAGIDTDSDSPNGFSQKFGYFECRCILPKGADIWSAFWLMNDGVYVENGTGTDGTEIDIFESDRYEKKLFNNRISSNLHYDGYGNAHQSMGAKQFLVNNDPYEEFNTYALEWNENEYIFYINGVETFRTDYGGVSQNEEYLILSVEMRGENAVPSQRNSTADSAEFIVDYVRVYQYNEKIAH